MGAAGYALHGTVQGANFVFAISSSTPIGANTTIWLDTDVNRATGYQIWGFAGGAEYNINVGTDGVPRLYSGGAGGVLVGQLSYAFNATRTAVEIVVPRDLVGGGSQVRVFADVNDSVFIPNDYAGMNLYVGRPAEVVGAVTLDGAMADWGPQTRLDGPGMGAPGYALHGDVQGDSFVFAITSASTPIGANTTIWLDTDLNRATGYQIWGFAGGAEYNINIGTDGVPRLYTGGAGEVFVAELSYGFNTARTAIEIAVPRSLVGGASQVRVLADVNDSVFIPNNYSGTNLYVGREIPVVGSLTLDGSLADWGPETRLDGPGMGAAGYALHGDIQGESFVFAISSDSTAIGANTTIWLDTDSNRATGYQIWGFAGGAEYNINIGADGVPRLYTGGAGEIFVAELSYGFNTARTAVEIAVPRDLLGGVAQVRVLADVNDSVFIPNDYSGMNLYVGKVTPVVGSVTLDGALTDWAADTRLDGPGVGTAGYALHGDVQAGNFVFAISSTGTPIGTNTTIWLNTDMNGATGYQIWGFAGGAEYNINIGTDGVPRLYTGGAGEIFVSELSYGFNANRTAVEIAVPRDLVGGASQVRVLADVNDSAFIPADYSNANLVVGVPEVVVNSSMKIGIVYSETTAAHYYDLTNYGQLFMSAQNQAMQAGLPFDVLSEADLKDAALLSQYGAIVFPGFSHVKSADVNAITAALAQATGQHGVGLIASGNFMTNNETGAAIAGDSYARMKALLGVTLEGYGTTTGVQLVATGSANPILDGYGTGEVAGNYTNTSYLNFRDITGAGETLFTQSTTAGSVAGVIATNTAARNVHFATDSLMGNNNILGEAIDWVVKEAGAPDVSLQLTRGTSLFHARNDMDQSQEIADVAEQTPGIYDVMLPIVEDWYERFGFVGSYYVNIGANPPDQRTDWNVSLPYYQRLLALGSEIGSHTTTHPEDTNLLTPDSPAILALFNRVDPRNPAAVEPSSLTAAERTLLFNSYIFQFEYSRLLLEEKLGIPITGAAVPGAPEKLAASHEIIRFFDYLGGGYSGIGAGYPNAFGFLTDKDTSKVYLAPNMSFDFSLIGFQNMTPAQAEAVWAQEYARIADHATTPIFVFPWHDYGPTNWNLGDPTQVYSLAMFESVLARAAADGAEFVTGQDLAERIKSFEASNLQVSVNGNVVTASVTSPDAGRFALDVGGQIASVANWYAWNGDSVLLPKSGGTYTVTLGPQAADVTRLAELPMRAELVSVSGDGSDMGFVFDGVGTARVVLKTQGANAVVVTGTDGGTVTAGQLALKFAADGVHNVNVDFRAGGTVTGTAAAEMIIGGSGVDRLAGALGNDTLSGGGGADSFVFRPSSGADVVLDFTTGLDRLIFDSSLGTASQIFSAFQTTTSGLLASFANGTSVLLAELAANELKLADISTENVLLG